MVLALSMVKNPKHEIRNPKQIQMTKIQNPKHWFRKLEFKISNLFRISNFEFRISKGFTLLELLVVVAVIIILTAIVLPNYRSGDKGLALQRSASKLAQDLRRTQEMSMSARKASGSVPDGFGIYFNIASPNSYILFADFNDNHHRDGGDQDLETINLESKIRISNLSPAASFSIVFAPPDPTVWINDLSSGVVAQITLSIENNPSNYQIISVNNAGLVSI